MSYHRKCVSVKRTAVLVQVQRVSGLNILVRTVFEIDVKDDKKMLKVLFTHPGDLNNFGYVYYILIHIQCAFTDYKYHMILQILQILIKMKLYNRMLKTVFSMTLNWLSAHLSIYQKPLNGHSPSIDNLFHGYAQCQFSNPLVVYETSFSWSSDPLLSESLFVRIDCE